MDAYYPSHNLVLEFREGQHYGDHFAFRDSSIMATRETRKEQRVRYDKRWEEVLPTNGIKLLVIYDYQITSNYPTDIIIIKEAVDELLSSGNRLYNRA